MNTRKWPKWLIIASAPIEIIGCAILGAAIGARDGFLNIRDALQR